MKWTTIREVEREDRRKAKARRKGELPPPACVIKPIKRGNSWQARYWLKRSMGR